MYRDWARARFELARTIGVVPANAGTHTPRTFDLSAVCDDFLKS